MFCKSCGTNVPDGIPVCPECGAPLDVTQVGPVNYTNNTSGSYEGPYTGSVEPNGSDIIAGKSMAIISYVTIIGFLIAICSDQKDNPFVKFHMNQSLMIFIGSIILGLIPGIRYIGGVITLIYMIMGIVSANNGETKDLPLFDKINVKIIK